MAFLTQPLPNLGLYCIAQLTQKGYFQFMAFPDPVWNAEDYDSAEIEVDPDDNWDDYELNGEPEQLENEENQTEKEESQNEKNGL